MVLFLKVVTIILLIWAAGSLVEIALYFIDWQLAKKELRKLQKCEKLNPWRR